MLRTCAWNQLSQQQDMANTLLSAFERASMPDPAGTGAHTNFSTESMRKDGGMAAIMAAIDKLSKTHAEHISQYGTGAALGPFQVGQLSCRRTPSCVLARYEVRAFACPTLWGHCLRKRGPLLP